MIERPYRPGPSAVHGVGVIATRLIRVGERIYTDLGPTYNGFNHACSPALGRRYDSGRLYAPYRFALREIAAGSELTIDYRTFVPQLGFTCLCPRCVIK